MSPELYCPSHARPDKVVILPLNMAHGQKWKIYTIPNSKKYVSFQEKII